VTEAVAGAADGRGDPELIEAVRRGDANAFGVLYERHLAAARRAAVGLVSTAAEREDLVAEGFTRVLRALRAGRGPVDEFRPYLLVTMRNAVISNARRGRDVVLYGQEPRYEMSDPLGNRAHAAVAADAFASLPERWRIVLWHTEVEGESPAEIAPLLDMSPNSVSALAYRAREGLRQAYLEQHLPAVADRDCRATVSRLTAWVRRGRSPRAMRRVSAHLAVCASCRERAATLTRINKELPGVVAPVVTAIKLALAGAAIVTTTAVSSVASGSGPVPTPSVPAVERPVITPHQAAATITAVPAAPLAPTLAPVPTPVAATPAATASAANGASPVKDEKAAKEKKVKKEKEPKKVPPGKSK
jgi:RNA polymerase sigma factor (sigma-70 family)